jgi:hypothetical protein
MRFPEATKLCSLFDVVDDSLSRALQKMGQLNEYFIPDGSNGHKAPLPAGVTTDLDLVKDALDDVASAWHAFEVVANTEQLERPELMRIIKRHLRRVLRLAISLVQLAAPRHKEWTDTWKEAHDAGLPDFKFDTEEMIRKGQESDPTWASILPETSRVPPSYISLSSIGRGPRPYLVRNTLNGGGPVAVNELASNAWRCGEEHKNNSEINGDGAEDVNVNGENEKDGADNVEEDWVFGYYNGGYY